MTDHTRVADAMRAVRAMPDAWREYSRSDDDARFNHRISAPLLDELVSAGLPHVGTPGKALFDDYDLANVSAHLRLRSAWLLGQKHWPAALARLRSGEAARFEIDIQPRCPYPGHQGQCRFTYLLEPPPDVHEPTAGAVATRNGERTMIVSSPAGSVQAGPAVREILACLDRLDYMHLPEAGDGEREFPARTGLANCVLAAQLVREEAARRGHEVRPAFGITMVPPYAGMHSWVEFRVDGRWTAFDPHLLRFLERSGALTPGDWSPTASVSGLYLRLGAGESSLAGHGASHAELSFRVREAA